MLPLTHGEVLPIPKKVMVAQQLLTWGGSKIGKEIQVAERMDNSSAFPYYPFSPFSLPVIEIWKSDL
jgi:hypothetical protein